MSESENQPDAKESSGFEVLCGLTLAVLASLGGLRWPARLVLISRKQRL